MNNIIDNRLTDIQINNKVKSVWKDIIKRTTSGSYLQTKKSCYIGCTVADEWRNYDNFYSWYISQTGYNLEGYEVDKDLLIKGNKVYSSDTCVLLPKFINSILTTSKASRTTLPIGVMYNPKINKFIARCRTTENGERKKKTIGYYPSPEEAFVAYKKYRENYIRSVAVVYKPFISDRAYNGLMSYKVEITD
jgi:hypothetical protein